MQLDVDDTVTALDTSDYADQGGRGQTLILQNLGVGDIYFDFVEDVDENTGVKIEADGGYEVANWSSSMNLYVYSDTTADLRYTVAG